MGTGTVQSTSNERDFYRRLLDLGNAADVEPLLDQALALIVEVTDATSAYLELHDLNGPLPDRPGEPRFWRAHHLSESDLATIRGSMSSGIVARALAEGKTIDTPFAALDQRFSDLGSVRQHAIEAVLCAPVGDPPLGVVYLQGRAKVFDQADREHVELFARQLAPLADRLVRAKSTDTTTDYTREIRHRVRCSEFVGRSQALARVLHAAAHVAHLDVDVLITGPSGTGKSMLARTIANNSPRQGGPFVELNCAAIPDALIESELFGAERGAHSTATRRVAGKVAAAEGGTLFLDEIGELSAAAQAKLLQLLETREYHALGATTTTRANVRILSATNRDLEAAIAAKQFRGDLYYRLHVIPIELPGLDARREDIPDLVEHFCAEACARHKLAPLTVSRRVLHACQTAEWPGHTRQLARSVEAAVIRASGEGASTVGLAHMFPDRPSDGKAAATDSTLHEATRTFQRQYILDALERHGWNVSAAAEELDLARSHLYNLMSEHGLRREGAAKRQPREKKEG